MKVFYIFIDESGNFDFSTNGTKHFVVAAYVTNDPVNLTIDIASLRYKLLSSGYEQESFHATEDRQYVRNAMYNIISTSKGFYNFVSVEKIKLPNYLQNKKKLYALSIKILLENIFRKYKSNVNKKCDQIIVVFDKILTNEEKSYLYKIVRPRLKKFNVKFELYFFQTKSDYNAQIADYGSWAKYVSLERTELRPLKEILHLIVTDKNIL